MTGADRLRSLAAAGLLGAALLVGGTTPAFASPAPASPVTSPTLSPCAAAAELAAKDQREDAERLYRSLITVAGAPTCAIDGLATVVHDRRQASVSSRWDAFYSEVVAPLQQVILPLLAVWLFLLVCARLATFLVGPTQRGLGLRIGNLLTWLGQALLLAAALTVTLGPSLDTSPKGNNLDSDVSWPWSAPRWVYFAALAVAGILVLSQAVGRRLSLQIQGQDASGTPNAALADYVQSRLVTLGGTPPRGLAVPQATDVTQLPSDALTTLPEGQTAQAILRVIQALIPTVSWRARVTAVDAERIVVTLTRNGRLVASTPISRLNLALPPLKEDAKADDTAVNTGHAQLLTAAAAFVLVHLATPNRWLQVGLCGCSRWQSLAQHVLATDLGWRLEDGVRTTLLSKALDDDPKNNLARVAYLTRVLRSAAYDGTSWDYAQVLHREYRRLRLLPDRRGYDALLLRLLYTQTAVWLNIAQDNRNRGVPPQTALDWAESSLHRLMRRCRPEPDPDLAHLVGDLRAVAVIMWDTLSTFRSPRSTFVTAQQRARWTKDDDALTARGIFGKACLLAVRGHDHEVIAMLRLLTGAAEYLSAIPTDPYFERLYTEAADDDLVLLKQLTGKPAPIRFVDLPPFAKHAQTLTDMGIRTPSDLFLAATRTNSRRELQWRLTVDSMTLSYWQRVADLAQLLADVDVPTLNLLLEADVDSIGTLGTWATPAGAAELAERLSRSCRSMSQPLRPPDTATVAGWCKRAQQPQRANVGAAVPARAPT